MRVLVGAMSMGALVGLGGCGGSDAFVDLQTFMDEVRQQPPTRIAPVPAFEPDPPFTYAAASLRSPFSPSPGVERSTENAGRQGVRPDSQRDKQYLEGYDIEQFVMVGSMANASGTSALLRGAGGVHRLQVGDYLGRSDGCIVSISETRVELLEIVADGDDSWREQLRTLSLNVRS